MPVRERDALVAEREEHLQLLAFVGHERGVSRRIDGERLRSGVRPPLRQNERLPRLRRTVPARPAAETGEMGRRLCPASANLETGAAAA